MNEGGGVSMQWSTANTVQDLGGRFNNGSISGGLVVGGTIDFFSGKNSDGSLIIGGGLTVGEDVGASILGAQTWTFVSPSFNLFSHSKKPGC